MKTGRILFTISILALVGIMAVGTAQAAPLYTDPTPAPDDVTFHVLTQQYLSPIPPDSPDTIVISGTITEKIIAANTLFISVGLQNLCGSNTSPSSTPTPTSSPVPTSTVTPLSDDCLQHDIYYSVSVSIDWHNTYYIYGSGVGDYHGKNLAPWPTYHYGSSIHVQTRTGDRCGPAEVYTGSCTDEFSGMIPASDISQDPHMAHEVMEIILNSDYSSNRATLVYTITFSTGPLEGNEDCAGQYLAGALLGTVTVAATNSTGVNLRTSLGVNYPAPGSWFVVQVTSGTWQNNGIGAELQSLAYRAGLYWAPIGDDPYVGCESGNAYYLQISAGAGDVFLRVNDNDGHFENNYGLLNVGIYSVAAYTRYPSGCELQYNVGDLIEQKTVDASWQNGWPIDAYDKLPWNPTGGADLPKRYYMLETIGGPANLGFAGMSWVADLSLRDSSKDQIPNEWFTAPIAPFVECVVSTDLVGHVKLFFAMDQQVNAYQFLNYYYAFRVHDDTTYSDNSGTLGYNLYEATNMQTTIPGEVPTPTGCAAYSHDATPIFSDTTTGNDAGGQPLPDNLASGGIYGFQVVDGPWKDNGTNSYNVQISDDDGSTWYDLKDFPNLLCAASADGLHVIIYVYHAPGKIWRFRADDGDANFANNTLSIGMQVFEGESLINPFPTCYQDYKVDLVPLSEEVRTVAGNSSAGTVLKQIIKGGLYAIEITQDQMWYDGGTAGQYLVDITDDNGATWHNFEYYGGLCALQIGAGDRFRVYFVAASSQYKLRVRDADGNFNNNKGWVLYQLYLATDNSGSIPPVTGTPPPEWVVACNEAYARPDSYFSLVPLATFTIINPITISVPIPRVAEWLDYLRSSITYYFAWCPEHTEALKSIGQVYSEKEPLASIQDMMDFIKSIQTMLASYQSTGGAGPAPEITSQEPELFSDTQYIGAAGGENSYSTGGASTGSPWDLFMVGSIDPVTNVWFGGQIDLAASIGSTDLSGTEAYQALCSNKFFPLFGIGADPFCNMMAMMRSSKIITWLLLAIDLFASVWFLLKYVPGYLRRFWGIITGNKQLVGKVISNI